MYYDLSGMWNVTLGDGSSQQIRLPATLDEAGIGGEDKGSNQWHPDAQDGEKSGLLLGDERILTRFTRKHTWDGVARFSRRILWTFPQNKRIFLEVERTRSLRVFLNGEEVAAYAPGCLATPWVYELTGKLSGNDVLVLAVDNTYQKMPAQDIIYSSMATDETQTNWNGLLGFLRLREEEAIVIDRMSVFPFREGGEQRLRVELEISAQDGYQGRLRLSSEALLETFETTVTLLPGTNFFSYTLAPDPSAKTWEIAEEPQVQCSGEHQEQFAGESQRQCAEEPQQPAKKSQAQPAGMLYELTGALDGIAGKTVRFGIRFFEAQNGRLALNDRIIFLRSEANCCVFPESGHPPMEKARWREILSTYMGYGVNCLRFHSHCPPEAAFEAADELGILMQPELSHWNPRNAFETEESFSYYQKELQCILRQLANHPSFVMLTLGNELMAGSLGHERMDALLELAKKTDPTRLYANGSNVHYGALGCDAKSDFYTSSNYFEHSMRGTSAGMIGYLNHSYPNTATCYDSVVQEIRKCYQEPLFSFEVGQYEVLPDFHELEQFHGITVPANLQAVWERVKQKGLADKWDRMVEATGELALLSYREEVEAALRTKGYSGISLLGLQDFPGQGTALVGMLNSHLQPKAYAFAEPKRFSAFFRAQLPLAELEKYTYTGGELLRGVIRIANYGREAIAGALELRLIVDKNAYGKKEAYEEKEAYGENGAYGEKGAENIQIILPAGEVPRGSLGAPVPFAIKLEETSCPKKAWLEIRVKGTDCQNRCPIWIYPREQKECPANVYEARLLDETCRERIREGGILYFSPDSCKASLPGSIQAQFTTDFWSVGTFPFQEGGMGQLIEEKHAIFREFPTDFHTDWQWWPMAGKRAVLLPERLDAIVTELDSYAMLRHMAQLFECRCGKAKILFSTMELHKLLHYPEGRALQNAIYGYLASPKFEPAQSMTVSELEAILAAQ